MAQLTSKPIDGTHRSDASGLEMAKPTKRRSKSLKTKAKAAPRGRPASGRRQSAIRDARAVVRERRHESRRLVTRATFVGFSFDLSYLEIPGALFVPQLNALIVDQSEHGCCLVFLKGNPLTANLIVGAHCLVQIEPDRTLKAVIRWVKDLDNRLVNAGFEFV